MQLVCTAAVLLSFLGVASAEEPTSAQLDLTFGGPTHTDAFQRLWRSAPKPADDGIPAMLSTDDPLLSALPRWSPLLDNATKTIPFTEQISVVRLLGGWKDSKGSGDFIQNVTSTGYDADWDELWNRLDPIVSVGLEPLIVFDNTPWPFTLNTTGASGSYGNALFADDALVLTFTNFTEELVSRVAARYGANRAASWIWRVATEPNCECHWLDTTERYFQFYEIVSKAVKGRLGARARVGPGNFPKGMKMDMVADICEWLATNASHAPDILGISYYHDAGNGYRHYEMADAASWMRGYISTMPNAEDVAFHFMEYGTLDNALRRESHEPGAYGTALLAGGFVVALEWNISELYHWANTDVIGGNTLLYGWSWLFAVADQFVGCEAVALTSSLSYTIDWNETSVIGLGAFDPGDGSVFATVPTLYTLSVVYNPECYNSSSAHAVPVHVALTTNRDDILRRLGVNDIREVKIEQYLHIPENNWYDIMFADLAAHGQLADSEDPYVYKLKDMASSDGISWVTDSFAKYDAMQREAMTPTPFNGVVSSNDTTITVEYDDACPTTRILRLTPRM